MASIIPAFVFIARALFSTWAPGALIVAATVLWSSAALGLLLGWWP